MWSWSYRRWLGHPGVQNERLQATWRLSAMKSLWLSLGTLKTCFSEPDWAQTLNISSDKAAAEGPLNSFYLVLNLHPISQQPEHPTQLKLAYTGGTGISCSYCCTEISAAYVKMLLNYTFWQFWFSTHSTHNGMPASETLHIHLVRLRLNLNLQMSALTDHHSIHLTCKTFGPHPEANNMCSIQ